jgi:integrase
MALTDAKIRSAKAAVGPAKLRDGHGLYLEIRPSGAKLWRYRYRIAKKENVFAIGEYPKIGLAEARIERAKVRELVKQGIHPAHHRKIEKLRIAAESANTFEGVAREWIKNNRPNWSDYYCEGQVKPFLESDVFPYIGALPIRQVTAAHLLEILKRVAGRGAETVALLIRQWSSAIFRYAVATLRADADPAAALKGAITLPKVKHSKPLTRKEIPEFLDALKGYGGDRTTVIALRLALLTFVRSVELRAAEWQEFEFDRAEWRIPAERMKMREPHIVPLSSQSIDLLHELHALTGKQRYLFPSTRSPKNCMARTTLNAALTYMGYGGRFSAHGFRATASTMLNEMGFPKDVIERQLAHAERNKVRASYNQAEYLPERRRMMQAWADYLDELKARPESGAFQSRAA